MTDRLHGKVAVVTGGASGIGEGIVRRFIEEGARCVVADIQDGAAASLVADLGDSAVFAHTDVSDEDDVASAVATAVDRFGRIDTMVNNAGILGAVGPITETSAADWQRTIDV